MRKTGLVAVMVAVVMLVAGLAYAETEQAGKQPAQGERGKQWQEQKEKIAKELNLTAEQQQKLEANRKTQRETMGRLHRELKEKQDKLQELLKSADVTKASVDPLVADIKSIQDQLVDTRVNAIFAVKAILTPEQFTKLQQKAKQRQENRQENRKERKDNWRENKKDMKPGANQGQGEHQGQD
jgi:periplasmic protein CpxP/Spy